MDAVRLHLGGEPQRPQGHSLAFVTALLGQMGAADAFAVKAAIVGAAFDEQQLVPQPPRRMQSAPITSCRAVETELSGAPGCGRHFRCSEICTTEGHFNPVGEPV